MEIELSFKEQVTARHPSVQNPSPNGLLTQRKKPKAEQAVLGGWGAEMSTLPNKRACPGKREVGMTAENYCPKVQMDRRFGFGGV